LEFQRVYAAAMNHSFQVNRREALRRISAGTLLALGCWPGALRAEEQGNAENFRFLVINDTHCFTPECGDYLAGVIRQMKTEEGEICLHAGDLADDGERKSMEMVKAVFGELGRTLYPVLGNHDYKTQTDCGPYMATYPDRVNYSFEHRGWQFVALDTTQGLLYDKTSVQPATLRWVDDHLPGLDKKKPMVIHSHFPMGAGVKYRPANADDLLDRFRDFNLRAVFDGHWHGFTERTRGATVLTTNRCCSLKRDNHDGTKEKGYFVCEAKEGQITRRFVEYKTPPAKPTAQPEP